MENSAYFDLLYSNSMCRQSSMPTSILIELLMSGGMRNECTHVSFSLVTSAIRREIVARTKYLPAHELQAPMTMSNYAHLSLTFMPV